uniref:Transmembrane protein n=1 Tax=Heterorhabditis bacteriophora TaxID=37862 RepID=A0A1I7W997_HETBA
MFLGRSLSKIQHRVILSFGGPYFERGSNKYYNSLRKMDYGIVAILLIDLRLVSTYIPYNNSANLRYSLSHQKKLYREEPQFDAETGSLIRIQCRSFKSELQSICTYVPSLQIVTSNSERYCMLRGILTFGFSWINRNNILCHMKADYFCVCSRTDNIHVTSISSHSDCMFSVKLLYLLSRRSHSSVYCSGDCDFSDDDLLANSSQKCCISEQALRIVLEVDFTFFGPLILGHLQNLKFIYFKLKTAAAILNSVISDF